MVRVALGLAAGWWTYVPVHELLHVAACQASGGSVEQLEIAPQYGGAWLSHVFPFVVARGDYAGRLSGFDTRGSDWIYLCTDMGPFLLTVFPGVFLFRRAAIAGRSFSFGFWIPFALAPFLSVSGDAYEIGSILVTRLSPWSREAERTLLRGDDLFLKVSELWDSSPPAPWTGLLLAAALGLVWACLTYAAGVWIARGIDRVPRTTSGE